MAREIKIYSSSEGVHYLQVGMNANELASFSWQLYITRYGPRAIDWLQSMSLSFCSLMGGNIYLHNSDDVERGNFYGEQKDFKVGVVANQQPSLVKVLDSIGIHTDGTWSVESITIPASLNRPEGMWSKIPEGKFKRREGEISCEFLRNMKTSSGTISAAEAMSGEKLKAHEAYLILRHAGGTDAQLWRVDINMSKSR